MRCLLEAVRSSLPISIFVPLNNGNNDKAYKERVINTYIERSSWYKLYKTKLKNSLIKRGVEEEKILNAISYCENTDAFFEIASDQIVAQHSLSDPHGHIEESHYVPQGL